MSDLKRRPNKGVRFDDSHSGSSRSSTAGGSAISSNHSGSQYTVEYNIGALEESLRATIRELDDWKKKTHEAEDRLRKSEETSKARIKALELSTKTLSDDKKALEKDYQDLKQDNDALKKDNARLTRKLEKLDASHSEPSSPDNSGSKPRRSDSKRSKDVEADKHNARLKERFNRTGGEPSGDSSKPPSSSKTHRSSGRRMSVSSSERPQHAPYIEGWAGAPPSPSSSRRPEYLVAGAPGASVQPLTYGANTPRSAGMPMPMQRPSVEYPTYHGVGYPPEAGNYQAYR